MKFFVSTEGDDRWSGALPIPNRHKTDGPFASITRARNAIRNIRKVQNGLKNSITVMLRKGTYFLDDTITFTPQDSGTKKFTITYTNYRKEKVILSGGRRICGWKKTKANSNIWYTYLPEVKRRTWYFSQLFVNGERRNRTRIPEEGYYLGDGINPKEKFSFRFKKGDIKRWSNLTDIEVVAFRSWDAVRLIISKVDEQTKIVSFSGSARCPFTRFCANIRYYIENVFEALDGPGKWYLNQHTGMLYYWPNKNENLNNAEVIAPFLKQLVYFKSNSKTGQYVHHVNIEGITFSHCDWSLARKGYPGYQADLGKESAICCKDIRFCTFKNNIIKDIGAWAFDMERGCKNNNLVGNEISNVGAGGIKVGEKTKERARHIENIKAKYRSKGNVISHNHIHNGGIVYHGAVGIWIGQSSDNVISYNRIHDLGYTGISVGWTWARINTRCKRNIIEHNEIYNVMRLLNDGAGIYTLGKSHGTIIRNNLIHDVYSDAGLGYGIYLDESSEGILVINNIVYQIDGAALFLHWCSNNVITNNIFAEGLQSQCGYAGIRKGNKIVKNLIYYTRPKSLLYDIHDWKDNSLIDCNLIFHKGFSLIVRNDNKEEKFLRTWQEIGVDRHSIIADPLFGNIKKGNFLLKDNSPAFKIGFKSLPMSSLSKAKKVPLTKEREMFKGILRPKKEVAGQSQSVTME